MPDKPLLALRGLAAFANPMPEQIAKLSTVYGVSGRTKLIAIVERSHLEKELREIEADENVSAGTVLVNLHRRREIHRELAELARIISEEGAKEETAVEIAEAVRASEPIRSQLTVSSTAKARLEGLLELDEAKLDRPLPAEYTERLRREHRRRMGGG